MKELDISVFIAVFQEMLGAWLWVLLLAIIVSAGLFIWLLVREKGMLFKRFVWSQGIGLVGGVIALFVMTKVSSSGFTDAGGPADWFLIALVYGIGFIVSTVAVYTCYGCWKQMVR